MYVVSTPGLASNVTRANRSLRPRTCPTTRRPSGSCTCTSGSSSLTRASVHGSAMHQGLADHLAEPEMPPQALHGADLRPGGQGPGMRRKAVQQLPGAPRGLRGLLVEVPLVDHRMEEPQ